MTSLYSILLQMNAPQRMMDSWGGGYGMIFMSLLGLLVLTLLVALIWFLIQKGSKTNIAYTDSPIEILNKRYARGEIDEEQYRKMKKDLTEM